MVRGQPLATKATGRLTAKVRFNAAPTSVRAATGGRASMHSAPIGLVVLPVVTYPSAIGHLGPDRSGRLVLAGCLPYDPDRPRDGVP